MTFESVINILLWVVIIYLILRKVLRKIHFGKRKSMYDKLMEIPEIKEMKIAQDYQINLINKMRSTDQDEIPWGEGTFGYDATNPIPTSTNFGSIYYLSRLQTLEHKKVRYNRIGSITVDNIDMPVDSYEISDDSGFVCTLYVSMYHKKTSQKAPDNFVLLKDPFLKDE